MKKIIKISLIAVVAIGIITAIFYSTQAVEICGDEPIATTSFEKRIQDRSEKEINNKPYADAKLGFNSILQEINTEASIILGDGSKNLSNEETIKSKKIIFYDYAPIFTEYGTSYFNRSSWDDATLKSLQNEAQTLQNMKIAESKTKVSSGLALIISTVNDYYAAWNVAKSASSCSSISAIKSVVTSANKYKKKPLTNNASLAAALNSVETTAKSSVVRNIVQYCSGVANRSKSHSNYASWLSTYESACERIAEYKKAYGNHNELQKARDTLDNADSDALDYYSVLEQNSKQNEE